MKIFKWEFWPYWLFYTPVYFHLPLCWLRSGSLTFFTAVNPGMKHGGFINYSKFDSLEGIPAKYLPKSRMYDRSTDADEIEKDMTELGIDYPIVIKPDRGERGYNVEILENREQVVKYLNGQSEDIILQEYIEGLDEYGVLYAKFPGEASGSITSVVIKEQMIVRGDGGSNLSELMKADRRCLYYIDSLEKLWKTRLDWVPAKGEEVVLNNIGNHSRGTIFRDGNHLITSELTGVFDAISSHVPEFQFGRYDVKAQSVEALVAGDFKIIEVNGVNSEPAHIYDPENSLFNAYRDLIRHWNLITALAKENIRRGVRPDSLSDVLASIREHLFRKRKVKVAMV